MKNIIIIITVLFSSILQAQGVFEYNRVSKVTFKLYSANENKLRKSTTIFDINSNSPENLARNYFFATSNEELSSLYADKEQFTPKKDSHFNRVKETNPNEMFVQLLHKTSYSFQGNEMCYLMFIAQIKDINFPFPTLLPLVKKGDTWLIKKRANQQKITDCLMMFKPCVLSNLIEGSTQDNDVRKLIDKTRSAEAGLDFNKLFDELVLIQNNEALSSKLTMSQNLECANIQHNETVTGQNYVSEIFQNINIKTLREQDELLISQIEKNNDSIVLTSKLDFEFSKRKYSLVKYNRINVNGETKREVARLDKNKSPEKPAIELIFLFENLETKIFSDLTPSMKETPIMNSSLFKESRGGYQVLNITKLYNLFINKKELFSSYIYK